MVCNIDTIDYRKDYYKGLAKIYFDRILEVIIDFGDLRNKQGLILDYGCGMSHLKRKIPQAQIVGYDIIPELSDVFDYQSLKPSKIVLSSMLEHLHLYEIDDLLNNFLSMNASAELIVSLPTENIVSKIAMHLAGQPHAHDDHVSDYREVNCVIERYYRVTRRKYLFFGMAQVSKYVNRAWPALPVSG